MKQKIVKMVMAAVFMALVCVLTMVIAIPVPSGFGYVHPGDAIVILCGIVLGKAYGFLAAGMGSALADIFLGATIYAPASFVIKGFVAFFAAIIFKQYANKGKKLYLAVLLGGVVDILLVVLGYFAYESILYSPAVAILGAPMNAVQGMSGMIFSAVLFVALSKVPDIKKMIRENTLN